jgi:alpha-glucoside transport system permease protein
VFTEVAVPELVPAGTAVVVPPKPKLVTRVLSRFGPALLRVGVVVVSLLWLVPTFGLTVASLRSTADNSATGWWRVFAMPSQLTLANYGRVMGDRGLLGALGNTVLITVPTTLLVVVLGALAAYALAWVEFRGREVVFVVIVALNVVPIQAAVIPDAAIFREIGLYGQIAAVVAFHVAFGLPFAIFLLRNFFVGLPVDLVEAARVDGASERRIFLRVIVPLGWPALTALAVFEFLWVWNDLIVALVFATSDNAPATYAIREQTRAFSSNIDLIAPGSLLSMLVPLMVFFAFQRYFVQGMLDGSTR